MKILWTEAHSENTEVRNLAGRQANWTVMQH